MRPRPEPQEVEQDSSTSGARQAAPGTEEGDRAESPVGLGRAEAFVGRLLSSSRYLILLAIVGSVVASTGVLVYSWFAGFAEAADDIAHAELGSNGVKKVSVEVISLVDLFLLGTVLYVVAVGLYQLFVDPNLPTPRWLKITDLDDLKERLLGTVVVLLSVSFLGYVVTWDGGFTVLGIGAAIGVVLAAMALLLGQFQGPHGRRRE
jgi:uncharacterized membrane protein YqhA